MPTGLALIFIVFDATLSLWTIFCFLLHMVKDCFQQPPISALQLHPQRVGNSQQFSLGQCPFTDPPMTPVEGKGTQCKHVVTIWIQGGRKMDKSMPACAISTGLEKNLKEYKLKCKQWLFF